MNSTISRSGGAKLDTCSALVATRAKKFQPGEKKTLYLCLGVILFFKKMFSEIKFLKINMQ